MLFLWAFMMPLWKIQFRKIFEYKTSRKARKAARKLSVKVFFNLCDMTYVTMKLAFETTLSCMIKLHSVNYTVGTRRISDVFLFHDLFPRVLVQPSSRLWPARHKHYSCTPRLCSPRSTVLAIHILKRLRETWEKSSTVSTCVVRQRADCSHMTIWETC